MNFREKIKETFLTKPIYDIVKYLIIAVVVPALYKYTKHFLDNIVPLIKDISTFQVSIFVVFLLAIIYICKRIIYWGTKRLAILNNSRIFYFRENTTITDKTRNRDFLLEQCQKANNIQIIGATGYQTFSKSDASGKAMLRDVLEKDITGEIKIVLLHPFGKFTRSRAEALGVSVATYQGDIKASVTFLKELKQKGKNVALKFYDQRPIWKMIILDDFLWLQHYHQNKHVEQMPVYGVSRALKGGRYSLFDPLYDVFQKKWRHDNNPIYDFETDEIVTTDPTTGVESRNTF